MKGYLMGWFTPVFGLAPSANSSLTRVEQERSSPTRASTEEYFKILTKRFSKAEDDEGEGNAMNGSISSIGRRQLHKYLLKPVLLTQSGIAKHNPSRTPRYINLATLMLRC